MSRKAASSRSVAAGAAATGARAGAGRRAGRPGRTTAGVARRALPPRRGPALAPGEPDPPVAEAAFLAAPFLDEGFAGAAFDGAAAREGAAAGRRVLRRF
jgi:hypothetical protein